jgi:hypothetical protein
MKGHGIQEVISLLADDELTTYAEPLQPAVSAAFEKATFINPKQPGEGLTEQMGCSMSGCCQG